jgi:hypothetical protein
MQNLVQHFKIFTLAQLSLQIRNVLKATPKESSSENQSAVTPVFVRFRMRIAVQREPASLIEIVDV